LCGFDFNQEYEMSFQRKLIVVALASALPWASAQAQSAADLQKEISALKAQLQSLQQKVEAMSKKPDNTVLEQQVNRLEQKLELADDASEKAGFKGLKINGTLEAAFKYDNSVGSHDFNATSGYTDSLNYAGVGMLQITKETQDGEGVDWTLRLLPGADAGAVVHEASVSIPLNKENRIIGGVIPDFQGYEYPFPNANSTLGNQLITHNALYDLAGASQYKGMGMAHTFDGGKYALKWLIANVDAAGFDSNGAAYNNGTTNSSVALAYRADWFANEYAYLGFSGLHGSVNRNFSIMALDGGYTRGDWQFNGQVTIGSMRNAATNGDDAAWTGLSAFVGYKATPRLQLLARADYIENAKNGGGTYVYPAGGSAGLGQRLQSDGATGDVDDSGVAVGANLMRLSLGTNYQINSNTQWKVEYRIDQSTGYNFIVDGTPTRSKNIIATSLMLSF